MNAIEKKIIKTATFTPK